MRKNAQQRVKYEPLEAHIAKGWLGLIKTIPAYCDRNEKDPYKDQHYAGRSMYT
jgi:hypothetical protein